MNWKSLFLGIGIGIAGAWATKEFLSEKTRISPEKALEKAKKAFLESGSVSGSWINVKPETYHKPPLNYKVYKGGISRMSGGQLEQYEFVADAKTGTIIEATKL